MEISRSKIKKFLIFHEMELSGSNTKNFFIFSQKKALLIFREIELFNILGNRNPKKIPYISEKRNFLIFQQTRTLKNFLYFRK